MNYHLFNPDHEIALAMNTRSFVPSRNVRQMCHDLAFLPALWADDGDGVIADDAEYARQAYEALGLKNKKDVLFLSLKDAATRITQHDCISPWGWNMAIRETLRTAGIPMTMLPTEERLEEWRTLSGRALATKILEEQKAVERTVGTAEVCDTICAVEDFLKVHRDIVIKAPYSSSGRGVRFVNTIDEATSNWVVRTIRQQGYVTVEKKYTKLLDFAVEYEITATGELQRKGLSVFQADGAAYTGNLLMSEEEKWNILSQYLSQEVTEKALCSLESSLANHLSDKYYGPFGVDMMMVDCKHKAYLHPCVEINLRRTMGHVALALSQRGERGVMRTVFDGGRFGLNTGKA